MVFGVIFMFIPTFFGNISGINDMTAVTSAKVVSVDQANHTKIAIVTVVLPVH
jgi:hypothetical protein